MTISIVFCADSFGLCAYRILVFPACSLLAGPRLADEAGCGFTRVSFSLFDLTYVIVDWLPGADRQLAAHVGCSMLLIRRLTFLL